MKKKLSTALQQKPYFLVLLPLFFIVHGYNEFFGFFHFQFLAFNFIITIFCTGLFYLLSLFYFKNTGKTALFTFWVLLFALTFGWFHDAIKTIFSNGFFSSYTFILPFTLLLLLVLSQYIKKNNSTFQKTFLFLNLLQVVFFLYETIDAGINYMQFSKGNNLIDNRFTAFKAYNPEKSLPASLKPDIYFIVFDGMPSSKSMSEINKSYNPKLNHFLSQKGFYIVSNSASNYNQTVFSITSTFNMDYVEPAFSNYNQKNYLRALESVKKNSLTDILKAQNYNIYQYQPLSFNNEEWNRKVVFDKIINLYYFHQTLPGRLYEDIGWHLNTLKFFKTLNHVKQKKVYQQAAEDFHYAILKTKESCSFKDKAKFVYTHVMIPHEPYLFDHNGTLISKENEHPVNKENEMERFYEQALYSETVIKNLITYILKFNKKQTIILIEGDHGFRSMFGNAKHLMFHNLNIIYFPDGDYRSLYPSISPVNSFRVVLNKYFSANLPLLKDSSIFIPYTLPGVK